MIKKFNGYFQHNAEVKFFVLSLCVRLVYLLINIGSEQNYETPDSGMYIKIAQSISQGDGFNDPERLPVYGYIFGLLNFVFGQFGRSALLVFQCVLDSFTVILFYRVAKQISSWAWVIGILSVFNMNLIAHSGLILTDSIFLFFLTLFVFYYLKLVINLNSFKFAILAGLFLGVATLTKPITQFFLVCGPLYLVLICLLKKKIFDCLRPASVLVITSLIVITPWLYRNYSLYGKFEFTSQKGVNVLNWYVPLVRSYSRGTAWTTEVKRSQKLFNEFARKKELKLLEMNSFERSALKFNFGKKLLFEEPALDILKAWFKGMTLNLLSPGITSASQVVNMERPGFYNSSGDSFLEKLLNFLFHPQNRIYLSIMVPGIIIMGILRCIQLFGLVQLVRERVVENWEYWLFLFFYTLYFLILTGPVVNASRYRLPIELPLSLLVLPFIHWLGIASKKAKFFNRVNLNLDKKC